MNLDKAFEGEAQPVEKVWIEPDRNQETREAEKQRDAVRNGTQNTQN